MALPKHPPLRYGEEASLEVDTRYPPSAPSQTPLHTTALMAGAAMQTPLAQRLHTTVPLASMSTSSLPVATPVNLDL